MGSKARYAHEFIPIILGGTTHGTYVEPFVGGANVIDKIPRSFLRFANDKNSDLIAFYRALCAGWVPPEHISKEQYEHIRYNRAEYPQHLVGFAGIACSYGGRWFKTYQRGATPDGRARNYVAETRNAVLGQRPNLDGVVFSDRDYRDFFVAPSSIVYCDPPYVGAVAPYSFRVEHGDFWRWCESLVRESGCRVFVSEYNAPSHWESVWSKEVTTTLGPRTHGELVTERLFTLKL